MAKDREYPCKYYLNEGNCSKGKEGTFSKKCQTCKSYVKLPGSNPRRKDLRQEKNEKWMNRLNNFY